jgi:hypothetical protein
MLNPERPRTHLPKPLLFWIALALLIWGLVIGLLVQVFAPLIDWSNIARSLSGH